MIAVSLPLMLSIDNDLLLASSCDILPRNMNITNHKHIRYKYLGAVWTPLIIVVSLQRHAHTIDRDSKQPGYSRRHIKCAFLQKVLHCLVVLD